MADNEGMSECRNYLDDCFEQIRRVALGRPCPDRDYCRSRLIDIMRAILVPHRGNPPDEGDEGDNDEGQQAQGNG
jgi:hypothetical protein